MFKKLVAIEPVSLVEEAEKELHQYCLLYTSPSPRD